MNTVFERIRNTGIVPVIQLEDASLAVQLAASLLDGGIDIAEITYRTAAAEESIRNISKHCPDMLVLAGTVLSVEQAQSAVSAGAKCIVSPGYDEEVVEWCIKNNVAVIPGIADASQIQKALKKGLHVLKLFPAESLGGTKVLDAFAGPFAQCMFMPTGGINADNMTLYAKKKNVIAISGSWIATKQNIASQDWESITLASERALLSLQGFEFAHVGMNSTNESQVQDAAVLLKAFGFLPVEKEDSIFCGSDFEILKPTSKEKNHITILANNIERALHYLNKKGFALVDGTQQYAGTGENKALSFVQLNKSLCGFDIHLKRR